MIVLSKLRYAAALVIVFALLLALFILPDRGVMAGSGTDLKRAIDFTLHDLDGKSVSLKKARQNNRLVLVNFWATWCPPCRGEIPELASFYRKYKERGVELLAVALGEDPATVRDFAARYQLPFPVLLDRRQETGRRYGVNAIPTTFLLDTQGRIRARFVGGVTMATLRAKVDPLLK